ncbi:hypothetical protein AB0B45_50080 [Nonomuraea sp. NPDC049152]|uniref:RICIN domain-containing protein n=1 Tax=Nonomuraea sp. NPDC049152 TaxID=3154350 RepID=UPI0033CF380D
MKRSIAGALVGIIVGASLVFGAAGTAQAATAQVNAGVQQRILPVVVAKIGRRLAKELIKAIVRHFKNEAQKANDRREYMRAVLDDVWNNDGPGVDDQLPFGYHVLIADDSRVDLSKLRCDDCPDGRPILEQETVDLGADGTQQTFSYSIAIFEKGEATLKGRKGQRDRIQWIEPETANRADDGVQVREDDYLGSCGAGGCNDWQTSVTFAPYGVENKPDCGDEDLEDGCQGGGDGSKPVPGNRLEHGKQLTITAQGGFSLGRRTVWDKGDGTWEIEVPATGNVLEVIPNNWRVEDKRVHHGPTQLWRFIDPEGDGWYSIKNVYNMTHGYPQGGCLTVDDNGGRPIWAIDCNKPGNQQLWKLS